MASGNKTTVPDFASIEGKFFHTFCVGHRIESQGRVVASLGDGYYMVQLYEWFVGTPSFTGRQIRHLRDMSGPLPWAWYGTDEEMRESYQYSGAAHGDGKCECQQSRATPNPEPPDQE